MPNKNKEKDKDKDKDKEKHKDKDKDKEKHKDKDKDKEKHKDKDKEKHKDKDKDKGKEKSSKKDKYNNRSKSVKSKKLMKSSSNKISNPLNHKNKFKTPLNKKRINKNKEKSYLSSIRLITSINNDLDTLNNVINSKFNYNNYNYNKNNSIFEYNNYNNKNSYKSSLNILRIKKMDDLYLYKQKNNLYNSHKIYIQPESELNKLFPSKKISKYNSFFHSQFSKKKLNINNYNIKRNIFFPFISSSFPFYKNKNFNISNINNACKVLLERD